MQVCSGLRKKNEDSKSVIDFVLWTLEPANSPGKRPYVFQNDQHRGSVYVLNKLKVPMGNEIKGNRSANSSLMCLSKKNRTRRKSQE